MKPKKIVLRNWQKLALDKWIENRFRGIVEVCTAGGKTLFATTCMEKWLDIHSNSKVLVIVPTISLLDQWFLTLTDDLNINPQSISCWPEESNLESQFHIMVVNTARKKSHLVIKDTISMIIADECHRYASVENAKALEHSTLCTLGLSATAERSSDDGLENILIPSLGPIIYTYDLTQAHKDEIISDYEIFNIKLHFLNEEKKDYNLLSKRLAIAMSQNDELKIKSISRQRARVSQAAFNRIPTTIKIVEENRGKRTIVFHEQIEKAEVLYQQLQKRGHSVAIYHSGIDPVARRASLRRFRTGIIDILVCCRALDEGIDIPEAEIAIIAASTSSSRQRIQRIGRVIRLNSGKDKAKIYTLYITESEHKRLLEEEQKLKSSSSISVNWFEVKGINNG
ncbi:MAG: DEAD/DEAH box helicase [Holophagaceae bacterium]